MSDFGLSALTSFMGDMKNLAWYEYQRADQQEDSSRAFMRQKDMMRIANEYAIDAERRQNAYNTPLAQRSRIEQAGLNPDLLYGNGTLQNTQQSALTGGSHTAPMSNPTPLNTSSSVLDDALKIAQIRNLGSEKTAKDLENQFNRETMDARIQKVGLDNKWTDAQISNVKEATAKIQAEYVVLHQQQGLNKLDAEEREIRIKNLDAYMKRQIREYDDKHNISKQELYQMQDSWELVKTGMQINNSQLDLNFENDKQYSNTERKLGMIGKVVGWALKYVGKK